MALKGLLRGDQCSGSFLLRDLLLFSGSVSGLCLPPSSPWLHLVSDLGPPSPSHPVSALISPKPCFSQRAPRSFGVPKATSTVPPPGCPLEWRSQVSLGIYHAGHLTRATWTARARPEGPPWAEGRTWKAGPGLSQARAHVCSQVTPPLPAELLALLSCSQRPGVHVSQTGTA